MKGRLKMTLEEENAKLKDRIEELENLDAEAATFVESVICIESNRFTAEPPYVGWKGLGLALQQDYDELKQLRKGIKAVQKELLFAWSCAIVLVLAVPMMLFFI